MYLDLGKQPRGAVLEIKGMAVYSILSPKTPECEHQSIQEGKNSPHITGFQPVLNKL